MGRHAGITSEDDIGCWLVMQRTTEVAPFVRSEFLIFKWKLRGEGLFMGACAALPEWRTRLARFAGSGQQINKSCKSESVSATAFYRWHKLLDQDAFPHLGFTSSRHYCENSTVSPAASPIELQYWDLGSRDVAIKIMSATVVSSHATNVSFYAAPERRIVVFLRSVKVRHIAHITPSSPAFIALRAGNH